MSQSRKRKKPAASASTSAKKPSRKRKGGNGKQPRKGMRWWPWVFKLGLVALVLGAVGVVYLDARITSHFEGKRWAIPAKVYARPLELYDGLQLANGQLAFELDLLNYRRVWNDSLEPGTFFEKGGRYRIATRGFASWEGAEAPRTLKFMLDHGRVEGLTSNGVDFARLEPAVVGGIYPAHNEDRVLVNLAQVPTLLVRALIAVEDRDYYEHFGLSPRGIARAFMANLSSGSVQQGGSTLTQQLVKNFYLSSKRTLTRKGTEAVMAVLLDFHYSKDEILEAYLNEVYLGQAGRRAIHGFGLASLFYFGQPIQELKPHQVALLIGLVKGPSYYDPRRNPERAQQRRDQVLQIMLEQGVIDEATHANAVKLPLGVIKKPQYEDARYPAFMDLVKRQLKQDYKDEDLRSEGLHIFTTLDPWAQEQLEQAIDQQTGRLQKSYGKSLESLEAAGVITASNTGEVAAIVGGRSFRYEGFNRALDAKRPIGSLAKPAVYLAALEQGYHLGSVLQDEPLNLKLANGKIWSPENFDKEPHGEVPLLHALANSYNLATARLALDLGLDSVVSVFQRLGVEHKLPAVPSIALGAVDLSPFEVAKMYQTIATEGFGNPLRAVRSVQTSDGEPLQRYELKVQQRFEPADIYTLVYALQEVVRSGTARSVNSVMSAELNLAGKTGTSNEQRDSWFAGFSGNYLGVIWMGRDDNEKTPLTGSSGSLRAWSQAFSRLPLQPLELNPPADLEWIWWDPVQQARVDASCNNAIEIPVRRSVVPEVTVSCGSGGRMFNWFRGLINDERR